MKEGLCNLFRAKNDSAVGIFESVSKFGRENIPKLDFELVQNCLQLIESDMVLSAFNSVQRGVGDANLFRKISVGEIAPRLSQEFCKLAIQVSLHRERLTKLS